MDDAAIYAALTPIFEDVMDEEVELTPQLTAADVEGWDSLSHIRLVVAIEEHFRISFTSAEIADLPDLRAFVGVIVRKAS